jgi:hypothetical protein
MSYITEIDPGIRFNEVLVLMITHHTEVRKINSQRRNIFSFEKFSLNFIYFSSKFRFFEIHRLLLSLQRLLDESTEYHYFYQLELEKLIQTLTLK